MSEFPCAFHPDRLTLVSCSRCERPICPDDMIPAPVGNQCPICAGRMREGFGGQAAYRVRTKAEASPVMRRLGGKDLTRMLAGVCVAIAVLMLATGRPTDTDVLIRFGALIRPLPRDEWWRIFSSMFVHIGLLHLLFNMFALISFGPAIENRYGKLRFLGLYLTSGLLGAAASLTFNEGIGVAAGASGGVFGILGAWIAFFVRHRNLAGSREQLRSLLFLVGINLVIGLTGSIDNFAHLGGLVGGFALGSVLELGNRLRDDARIIATLGGFVAVAAIAAAMVLPRTCVTGQLTPLSQGRVAACGALLRAPL
ncbi:MAG: rhomboid family intramembrane serine protease [Actinomycetota bacterium]